MTEMGKKGMRHDCRSASRKMKRIKRSLLSNGVACAYILPTPLSLFSRSARTPYPNQQQIDQFISGFLLRNIFDFLFSSHIFHNFQLLRSHYSISQLRSGISSTYFFFFFIINWKHCVSEHQNPPAISACTVFNFYISFCSISFLLLLFFSSFLFISFLYHLTDIHFDLTNLMSFKISALFRSYV